MWYMSRIQEEFQHLYFSIVETFSLIGLGVVFLSSQAALQKQQQEADMILQGTLESSNFHSGDHVPASAAGPLCAALPAGEEAPTVNGGQSDSYSESMDREPEPEPAEEVSENGPLLGWWTVAVFTTENNKHAHWSKLNNLHFSLLYG